MGNFLWKVECDRCGGRYMSNQLRLEWNGLRVCHGPGTADCWDPRHPQDTLRGRPDRQAPPWTRPPKTSTLPNTTTADDL